MEPCLNHPESFIPTHRFCALTVRNTSLHVTASGIRHCDSISSKSFFLHFLLASSTWVWSHLSLSPKVYKLVSSLVIALSCDILWIHAQKPEQLLPVLFPSSCNLQFVFGTVPAKRGEERMSEEDISSLYRTAFLCSTRWYEKEPQIRAVFAQDPRVRETTNLDQPWNSRRVVLTCPAG